MARPRNPSRNTASLPETPCASRTAPHARSPATAATDASARRLMPLAPRIALMTLVTALVQFFADLEDAVGTLLPGGIEGLGRGFGHRFGHRRPVLGVQRPFGID